MCEYAPSGWPDFGSAGRTDNLLHPSNRE